MLVVLLMQVHQQPCHIVYTDYRPTPLQHYIFPAGGHGLYLVVDEKGKFREDSFHKALNSLVPTGEGDKRRENGKRQKGSVAGKVGEESDIFKMVKMIIQRQYDPVIIFSFSKRDCEFLAMQVSCFFFFLLFPFFVPCVFFGGEDSVCMLLSIHNFRPKILSLSMFLVVDAIYQAQSAFNVWIYILKL